MNGLALRSPSTVVSVCSGVGGLDLGLHAAIPGLEPVVYIEREAHAAAVLVARMEEAALPRAPVWDDVCTFDARGLVGLVDLVAGGTPCQDMSLAGKRRGLNGERSRLFFEHARIASECEAPFFFWENVGGAVGTVPIVAEHLHGRGYDSIVWATVRARDVGAPHERNRVFLLAYSSRVGQREPHHAQRAIPRKGAREDAGGRGGGVVGLGVGQADSDCLRQLQQEGSKPHQRGRTGNRSIGVGLAHTERQGLEERRALRGNGETQRSSSVGGGLGVFPPGRSDSDGWRQVIARRPDLAPATPVASQSGVRGLAHGLGAGVDVCLCPREDRLRAAGNGVVPQQAAIAWRILWPAIGRMITGAPPP